MDFELDEAQTAFSESVRRFSLARLAEGALARAHEPGYPWEIAEQLAGQGLIGLTIPAALGGQGATL